MRSVAPGFNRALVRPLTDGVIATLTGAISAYATLAMLGNIASLTTTLAVFTQGLIAGIVGLTVVAGTLVILRNQEFQDMRRAIHRLARKRGITLPTFGAS